MEGAPNNDCDTLRADRRRHRGAGGRRNSFLTVNQHRPGAGTNADRRADPLQARRRLRKACRPQAQSARVRITLRTLVLPASRALP